MNNIFQTFIIVNVIIFLLLYINLLIFKKKIRNLNNNFKTLQDNIDDMKFKFEEIRKNKKAWKI
jgi:hypothetical protein